MKKRLDGARLRSRDEPVRSGRRRRRPYHANVLSLSSESRDEALLLRFWPALPPRRGFRGTRTRYVLQTLLS